LPAADDLEGWRHRLREAKGTTGRQCVVGAWLELWGGGLDGYGNPVVPDGLPACEATSALRSAAEYYWRATGDRTDPNRPRGDVPADEAAVTLRGEPLS
jgi:hypothetical protein